MSELVRTHSGSLALPNVAVTVRAGERRDVAFMDGLQKQHTHAVGWMPTKQFEGKIDLGHVLIAQDLTGRPVGYCLGNDRYFKRDDVGIIYQMNVLPERQGGLIGATLLKAQFERSAYGCRLYCCWCAQDLPANRFWQAMGFVPLAVRAGSATKGKDKTPRVHIFWQKRITVGDETTPWWFPSKTDGGAMRADRLAIPIPPNVHWSEAMPLPVPEEIGVLPDHCKDAVAPRRKRVKSPQALRLEAPSNGLSFCIPRPSETVQTTEIEVVKAARPKAAKVKANPQHVAAARELRDRYLEEINGGGYRLEGDAKYDVARLPSAGSIFDRGRTGGLPPVALPRRIAA